MKLQDYIAYLEELTAFKKEHDGPYVILGEALAKAKTITVPDDKLRELEYWLVGWRDGTDKASFVDINDVIAHVRTLLNDVPTAKPTIERGEDYTFADYKKEQFAKHPGMEGRIKKEFDKIVEIPPTPPERRADGLVEEMAEELRCISENYDHDEDAHKHGTPCRVCDAARVLAKYRKHHTPAPEDNCAGITSRPSEWAEFKEWKWQKKYGTPAPDRLAAELKAWIKTEQDDYAALGSDGISSNARCNLLEELRIKIIRYDTPNTTEKLPDQTKGVK